MQSKTEEIMMIILEEVEVTKEESETLAGHAGKPLTLASTRSPKLKWPLALALFAPRRRPGAMAARGRYTELAQLKNDVVEEGKNRKIRKP